MLGANRVAGAQAASNQRPSQVALNVPSLLNQPPEGPVSIRARRVEEYSVFVFAEIDPFPEWSRRDSRIESQPTA